LSASATSSPMVQIWSVTPSSMAGVHRSVSWTRHNRVNVNTGVKLHHCSGAKMYQAAVRIGLVCARGRARDLPLAHATSIQLGTGF
jgi:hypothetical protein